MTLEYIGQLIEQHRDALKVKVREFTLGDQLFAFNSQPAARIMGVINLSPDSWYRESVCTTLEGAVRRGRTLAAHGASIIDVGAESTLSHAALAEESVQKARLIPVIRALSAEGILVSAETYQIGTAKACLEAGAKVINLTGMGSALGEDLFRMVADHQAAVILCYVEGRNVREVGDFDLAGDTTAKLYEYFARQTELCLRGGLDRVLVDPGLGFYYRNLQDSSVRVRHQMTTFLNTFRLRKLGFPVCHALPHAFDYFGEEVRSAEGFFAVLAALGKTDLFRTHEVTKVKAVLDTMRVF